MSNKRASAIRCLQEEKRKLIGLSIIWRDVDPMSDNKVVSNDLVTHKNPVRRLHCLWMWKHQSDFILKSVFTWVIFVEVVFELPNKKHSSHGVDEGEFRLTAPFQSPGDTRMNDAIVEYLEEVLNRNNRLPDGHKNKGTYLHVNFQATIEGV